MRLPLKGEGPAVDQSETDTSPTERGLRWIKLRLTLATERERPAVDQSETDTSPTEREREISVWIRLRLVAWSPAVR